MEYINSRYFQYLTNIVFIFYIFQFIYPNIIPKYMNYYLSLFVLIGGQFNYYTRYYKLYKNTEHHYILIVYELIFHILPFIYFSRYSPKTIDENITSGIFTLIIFTIYKKNIDLKIYNDPIKYILTCEK